MGRWQRDDIPPARRRAYECVLEAVGAINRARAQLPQADPAHQELDEAALAVRVVLDTLRP